MTVEIRKASDGSGLLRCTRDDGSVTWQKQNRHGIHFAFHDLTHYAVETILGYQGAFFSLIGQGWEIEETTGQGPRGPLPPVALEVESLVGAFDSERASGSIWTAAEFNEMAAIMASTTNRPAPRTLTDDELQAVRKRRSELFREWMALPEGGALTLIFAE